MNRTTNTLGSVNDRAQRADRAGHEQLLRPAVRRTPSGRTEILRRWIAIWLLLLLSWVPVQGGCLKPDVDYSNYDSPLYEQVVDRIRAKIAARLQGDDRADRYFIVPFAYQNRCNTPDSSHSFLTVIRVLAVGKHASRQTGFRHGSYHGREFAAFTISWLPRDFDTNPHLCVFDGLGSRLFPSLNRCSISPGRNFNLEQTLKLALNAKTDVGIWGPFEIKPGGFELGVRRKRLLDGGTIRYRADDRLYRKDRIAINCFHAIGGLEELYPNGGFLGTGWRMWGINGTARVLIEYTKKPSNRALLLEPVDYKKDLYGFVYAPKRNAWFLYNPFPHASAYHE